MEIGELGVRRRILVSILSIYTKHCI